jgi:Mg2+/citrate symporter
MMNESNSMQGWVALTGSISLIALILTAIGLMLGIVKPSDALKRIGAILVIVIPLSLIPGLVATVWSGMSMGQHLSADAIALGVLQWPRPRPKTRNKKRHRAD